MRCTRHTQDNPVTLWAPIVCLSAGQSSNFRIGSFPGSLHPEHCANTRYLQHQGARLRTQSQYTAELVQIATPPAFECEAFAASVIVVVDDVNTCLATHVQQHPITLLTSTPAPPPIYISQHTHSLHPSIPIPIGCCSRP